MEDKIVYEYVSQAFLQAYVAAWRKYSDAQEGEEPTDEFLVIEEINRGNCAQIFGDLFQLLDRGDEGFSEYPIKADSDMKKLLEKNLKDWKSRIRRVLTLCLKAIRILLPKCWLVTSCCFLTTSISGQP